MYHQNSSESQILVGVYVDDFLVTGSVEATIIEFKKKINLLFEMSDLGLLNSYLGIQVVQVDGEIKLYQKSYSLKILKEYNMLEVNPCQTPLQIRLSLSKSEEEARVDSSM